MKKSRQVLRAEQLKNSNIIYVTGIDDQVTFMRSKMLGKIICKLFNLIFGK